MIPYIQLASLCLSFFSLGISFATLFRKGDAKK